MDFAKAKETFLDTQKRMGVLRAAGALLYWDYDTIIPPKAFAGRAEVMAGVEGEIYRLETAPEYAAAMEALREAPHRLTAKESRMLELALWGYDRKRVIPRKAYEAFTEARSLTVQAWKQAKAANDFAAFAPKLQRLIDYNREFVELWGYEDTPYDALLADYDPALLTARLDPVFARLREGTLNLLAKVPKRPITQLPAVPAANQAKIGHHLLRAIGYDLDAGNLYTTEHPFTCTVHRDDVRVTTKYIEASPQSSLFSVLHEGGHGIYEQRIDCALSLTNLMDGASMGIHESQSRFWENMVGRSLAFWQANLAGVNRLAGVPLAGSPEEFFRAVNQVRPSLIRIEADELTYNLHVIIRYEIEKQIFNEGVNAKDLPELWREKYREYLGVCPETDTEGVLQDSHWSDSAFGYFPSYSVGNLCGAQFLAAMEAQLGSLEALIARPGGLAQAADWLTENIYRYGRLEKPEQILQRVCGAELSAEPFLAYMEKKLGAVYGI